MKADALLADLRSEGKLISRGGFELDRQKAREKMQDYQLADPHQYVLRLVEAGHLLGTELIHVRLDADEMHMEFDGVGLSVDELEGLYDAVFSERSDRRTRGLRQLAIGLNAAHALEPAVVRVRAYVDGELATLEITDDGESLTDEVNQEEHQAPLAFTHIYLRERRRLWHLVEFVDDLRGDLPEELALRERCVYSPRSVFLDGQRLSYGLELRPGVVKKVAFATDHARGRLGVLPGADDIVIDLVQNGVKIAEHRQETDQLGVRGAIVADSLTRDLSQSGFVEDQHLERLTEELIPTAAFASGVLYARTLTEFGHRDYIHDLEHLADRVPSAMQDFRVTTIARQPQEHRIRDLLSDLD